MRSAGLARAVGGLIKCGPTSRTDAGSGASPRGYGSRLGGAYREDCRKSGGGACAGWSRGQLAPLRDEQEAGRAASTESRKAVRRVGDSSP